MQKPQRRGAETFAAQLSEELRDVGHDVATVYLYPHNGPGVLSVARPDHCLDGDESHFLERSLGAHPALLRDLRRSIAAFGPDIVQANGARTVKYAGLARRLDRGRWRLVYRNIGDPREWLRGARHRWFYRFIMARVDGVVGVSATTLQHTRAFYRLTVPTVNIPRAIRPAALIPGRGREEVRADMGAASTDRVLVYVGSLTPEKRVGRLLRLLADLGPNVPDVRLWLVGDGPRRLELEQLAAALDVADRALFVGSQADVAAFINAADLLVLCSDTEGVPGVILEAGWLGRPVVATDVGGVAECVREGETGLLVAPGDDDGLATAVGRLLDEPERRDAMGVCAHEWIAERFLMERIAGEYEEFYTRVLSE